MRLLKHITYLLLMMPMLAWASSQSSTLHALFQHPNDPIAGNPKGKVTIVEFFDYQCSHCISMAPTIDAIIQANPEVRVVFKDFPIGGEESLYAARVALAAKEQGKYLHLNHAFFNAHGYLSTRSVIRIAEEQGLNMARLKKDMYGKTVSRTLGSTIHLAKTLGVTGTPAIFIGPTNATDMSQVHFELGEVDKSQLQTYVNDASR